MTRDFHIGDVLSITTGRLLAPAGMDAVYRILNHLTGGHLYTHQLPRAADECKPSLIRQHPWLDGPELREAVETLGLRLDAASDQDRRDEIVERWLGELAAIRGATLPVEADPPGSHPHIDPAAELELMAPGKTIVLRIPESPEAPP
jgi:hypothetical protein